MLSHHLLKVTPVVRSFKGIDDNADDQRLSCLLSAGGVGGSVLVPLGRVFPAGSGWRVVLLVLAPRGVQRAVAVEEDDGDLEETHQPDQLTGAAAEQL
ncbi:hypothetical protein F7725_010722 [Dissostichus mawsoni]|uniref:Uncharacterized protein n=1 Tax=Dissostichus mawsoni TaxID=36200 RepID=A0A7J5XPD0_DISMA|nr:hypothetical protein F7725_010722 [Dissostichus mawsoni]